MTLRQDSTKRSELRAWMDRQYRKDSGLRRRVEALMNEIEIEQRLAGLRQERGVSQSTLSRMIGVSQPAIARIESGRAKNVELKTLIRYAAALGGRLRVEVVREPRSPRIRRLKPW